MTHNPLRSRAPVVIPPRPVLTKTQKVAAWNREGGICWWCGKPVAQAGPTVEYDHKSARELSGDDTLENLFPMHKTGCHDRKTQDEDRPQITKAHRQEKLTRPKERKAGGFRGWRRMNGEIVWRNNNGS